MHGIPTKRGAQEPGAEERTAEELIEDIDVLHAQAGAIHRELLQSIARADKCEVWEDWGARDMAHWLSMRYDISWWKASRWIAAAHALEGLPRLSGALCSGELGMDKAVEVARFATRETEAELIAWARGVSCAAVRRRGDLAVRRSSQEARDAERSRSLSGGTPRMAPASGFTPSSPPPRERWWRGPWSVWPRTSR